MKTTMREFMIHRSNNGSMLNRKDYLYADGKEEPFHILFENGAMDPEESCDQFLNAVMIGFRIAKSGYDKITVVSDPWEE